MRKLTRRRPDTPSHDRLDQDLEKHSPKERAEIIFKIIDASAFCKGVTLEKGEVLNTVIPHQSGIFKDEHSEEMRAFSDSCRIFSAEKNCCDQCQKLKSNSDQRKKRRMEFGEMVHPNTNKHYPMKDDIATQLQLERQARINAEKKAKYWREKFGDECIEMTEEDHVDLSMMFESASNIPEHMAGLWKQQKLLLSCKSKNAYRWHPKVVIFFVLSPNRVINKVTGLFFWHHHKPMLISNISCNSYFQSEFEARNRTCHQHFQKIAKFIFIETVKYVYYFTENNIKFNLIFIFTGL